MGFKELLSADMAFQAEYLLEFHSEPNVFAGVEDRATLESDLSATMVTMQKVRAISALPFSSGEAASCQYDKLVVCIIRYLECYSVLGVDVELSFRYNAIRVSIALTAFSISSKFTSPGVIRTQKTTMNSS
jgi:hypothetical protein